MSTSGVPYALSLCPTYVPTKAFLGFGQGIWPGQICIISGNLHKSSLLFERPMISEGNDIEIVRAFAKTKPQWPLRIFEFQKLLDVPRFVEGRQALPRDAAGL